MLQLVDMVLDQALKTFYVILVSQRNMVILAPYMLLYLLVKIKKNISDAASV